MAQHDHQFHVSFPVQGTISFVGLFDGKNAPIFVESLSDQYVVFYTHLGLPTKHNDELVQYLYRIQFLYDEFVIEGVLLREISDKNAKMKKFEGKFSIDEEQRSRLFRLLNQYSIMVHKLKNESQKGLAAKDKTSRRSSNFSKLV